MYTNRFIPFLIVVLQEDNLDPGVLTDHHSDKNSKSVESFPIESKNNYFRVKVVGNRVCKIH